MPSGTGTVQLLPQEGPAGAYGARAAAYYAVELAAITAGYFLLARLGLALASLHPSASPIWPPTGFALGVLLLRGYRVAPAILIGAFLANATTGATATAAAIAAGNALEALVGAALVNRWSQGRDTFATPLDVAKFALICAAVATPLSATIGVGALCLAGSATWASFAAIWVTWWLGDLTGALVLTPVIVLWAAGCPHFSSRAALRESGAILVATGLLGLIAFSPLIAQTPVRDPLGFLAIVPLLWAALRRGQRETATVALILAGFAIWGTLAGGGPFARPNLNDSLLLLLMFLISISVPSLALSATIATRRRAEAHLGAALHTERREAQAALELTREQLAQAQKLEALGQLTGGIAHDFNNLLMIVGGHEQILRRRLKPTEPRIIQALEAIRTAAKRGETLTRQLLTFARRQSLNPMVVELRERAEGIRQMLSSSLRGNIALVYDLPDDVWRVEIDIGEFELAMVNIAVNARDAMPDGGTLTLRARNVTLTRDANSSRGANADQLEGDFVELALTDTGIGIAQEHMAKVFEPFFTTKAIGKGTGLGLSQVYGFAHQSGGTVTAASAPGRGSTITLYLPRARAALSRPQETMDTPLAPHMEGTVLVVEDNAEVAGVTLALLEQLGYRTLFADNASTALARLKGRDKIDLVLSDIVMPGAMNGIELAGEIRRLYPHLPVLLTSGYSESARAAEARYAILRKPFELADLVRALGEAMARRVA
jgi:signal transduction histidine kinase/CheY-like chemotaxis protein